MNSIKRHDEGEIEDSGEDAPGEGEQRVLRARQNAALTVRDHVSAGQSVHHPPDQQLPEDATGVPARSDHFINTHSLIKQAGITR